MSLIQEDFYEYTANSLFTKCFMNTKTTILRTSQRNPYVRTFFCVREYGQLYRSCRSKKIFTNVLRILCLRNASWIPKQHSYELRIEILTYERSFVFVNTATGTLLTMKHLASNGIAARIGSSTAVISSWTSRPFYRGSISGKTGRHKPYQCRCVGETAQQTLSH